MCWYATQLLCQCFYQQGVRDAVIVLLKSSIGSFITTGRCHAIVHCLVAACLLCVHYRQRFTFRWRGHGQLSFSWLLFIVAGVQKLFSFSPLTEQQFLVNKEEILAGYRKTGTRHVFAFLINAFLHHGGYPLLVIPNAYPRATLQH